VTCMHEILLTLTLIYKGGRGMGELGDIRERVGRPSLTFPTPSTSENQQETS
jgi:hypothetical protein